MKLFQKIKDFVNRIPKSVMALFALVLIAAVAIPIVKAEYYPNRTPFDYNKECNPNDSDIYDRCGSLTGPVFNSFVNTPSYGDERAFVDARRSDQTASGSYKNVLDNVTDGSKEVVIRMYVHNNANQSTNASGVGIAKNTKVRVDLPEDTAKSLRARGYISADNATPGLVEDTVDFVDDKQFKVEYIPGSAKLFDNDNFADGVTLNDSIVTTGAPIGSDALDGNMKGCFEYEAIVQIRVRIKTVSNEFTKQVALPGAAAWGEKVTTKPGDTVKWMIKYQNTGDLDQTNVNISDKLPPHLQLVPGSVHYIDAAQDVVQQDAPLFGTGGINFGTWKQNGGFYVRFDTIAKDDFEACEVSLRNIAYNETDQTPKGEDYADVVIKKENCNPPTSSFNCDALESEKLGTNSYLLTARGSVTNAVIEGYTFKVTGPVNDEITLDGADNNQVVFQENTPGEYTVTVQVITDKGTTPVSEACTVKINVEEVTTPTYSCDLLQKKSIGKREYRFTTTASASGGATIKQYVYDFGDDTEELVTDKSVVTHKYAKDGTYVARVTVHFNVDGETKTATSERCEQTIKVKKNCPVPGKEHLPADSDECEEVPSELPKTGPAATASMFVAVTLAGAVAHRFIIGRRYQ